MKITTKKITTALVISLLFFTEIASASTPKRTISLRSLLLQMIDRDAMAHWPKPAYQLRQASSFDRSKTDPTNYKTWFSNHDYGQFLHVEINHGRKEWVIMDAHGPGAITRFWTPLYRDLDHTIIRFYFNGASTPTIAVNLNTLFSGRGFIKPPFAFVAWNGNTELRSQMKKPRSKAYMVGGDLYLPIPFAQGCKITLDHLPFYYNIDYRSYKCGTKVRTFSMAQYASDQPTLKMVGRALTRIAKSPKFALEKTETLTPGKELVLKLPHGAAAVSALSVRVDPKDAPQVLRSLVLKAKFDQEPCIWCPIGEFFGCGPRLRSVVNWCQAVRRNGTLTSRWIMPYRDAGVLALKNWGKESVNVNLRVATIPWTWDDRSMYFHATWHSQHGITTEPRTDWNYITIHGKGTYVGDTLDVYSPVAAWWGEGDEEIYVNSQIFPSQIGTGTEDYYGFAFGIANYFDSPFISAPQRDRIDHGASNRISNWSGYTTMSRLRLLDGIPFRTRLKVNIEIWDWAKTKLDYAVGTFWYARPKAADNRQPQSDQCQIPLHR